MSSFATRLNQFIDYLRISKKAFEEECQIAQGNVSHCIKNDKTLSSKNIVKISNRYDELNIDWLINNRGSMLISDYSNSSIENEQTSKSDIIQSRITDLENEVQVLKDISQNFNQYNEVIKWQRAKINQLISIVDHDKNKKIDSATENKVVEELQWNKSEQQKLAKLVESIVKSHPKVFKTVREDLSEIEYIHIISSTISKGSEAQQTSFYINSSYSAMCKLIDLGFVDSGTALGELLLKKAAYNHSYHICADIAKYLMRHYYRFEDLKTAMRFDELFYKYSEMNMIEYEAQKLYCEVIYNHKHGLEINKTEIESSLEHIRRKMKLDSCTYHYYYYQCLCILSEGNEYLKYCEEATDYFSNLYFNHEAYISVFLNKTIYYQIEHNELEKAEANIKRLFKLLKKGSGKWFMAMYSLVNLLIQKEEFKEAFTQFAVVINHSAFKEKSSDEKLEWQILGKKIQNEMSTHPTKTKISKTKN